MKKTYMIHEDESYADIGGATLVEFVGTEREMLEFVNGVDDENRDDEEEGERKFPSEFTDAELMTMFQEAQGDGSNVTTVFEAASPGKWKQVL